MRVLFLANPGPFDTPRGEHYEAGQVYDLSSDRAYKWTCVLGIAVEAPPEPEPLTKRQAKQQAADLAAVEPPAVEPAAAPAAEPTAEPTVETGATADSAAASGSSRK